MGYTTTFNGSIAVDPPLNKEEIEFLTKFNQTRRMKREKGPYYVGGSGFRGQGKDGDVIDSNEPPDGQPGLWCQWVPTDDGEAIEWDGGEKFYYSELWMKYIIEHFIGLEPLAKSELPFLQGHRCEGEISAQGEDPSDIWNLVVKANHVFVERGEVIYKDRQEI